MLELITDKIINEISMGLLRGQNWNVKLFLDLQFSNVKSRIICIDSN